MSAAKYDTVTVKIANGIYEFKANGSRMTFDGWKKVYKTSSDDDEVSIPVLTEGQVLALKELIAEQKFTQPPSRYTEASLVKEMEEKNIGRPSTYASIISVLINRKYVKRVKKSLEPTKLGFDVTGILEEYFSDIVDVDFTGEMEDNLDSVELGEKEWKNVISDFYKGFSEELKIADREADRIEKEVILTDEICELCGKPMAIKEGRFGQFLACSGYPECKNTRPIIRSTGIKCPECGRDIVEKRGRKSGKLFYGCSGYPECNVSYWDKPTGRMCPECGSMIVLSKSRNTTAKCSNPECKYREKGTEQ
jgi:DNA topoisomerase-1